MRFADGAAEAEARAWIEGLLDERLPEDTSLHECLKSGEVLCRAVNAIAPGTVRSIYTGGLPFKQMENVEKYLVACDKLGVPSFERFPTVALYENKDMASVVNNLAVRRSSSRATIGRVPPSAPSWRCGTRAAFPTNSSRRRAPPQPSGAWARAEAPRKLAP